VRIEIFREALRSLGQPCATRLRVATVRESIVILPSIVHGRRLREAGVPESRIVIKPNFAVSTVDRVDGRSRLCTVCRPLVAKARRAALNAGANCTVAAQNCR
jgi:acetoacetate decarboxylase